MSMPLPLLRRAGMLCACIILSSCVSQANGNGEPLPDADDRPTPLHFGLYVTPDPAQNPIDPPERFTGFHAATDFEIVDDEEGEDIPVYAVCTGTIAFSGWSEGYGGLITQYCTIDNQDVTVIYGHLAVDSLMPEGTDVRAGQKIGILGAGRSSDTDGTRKHLHLGIAKGHGGEVRGYVQDEAELELFLDPQDVLEL